MPKLKAAIYLTKTDETVEPRHHLVANMYMMSLSKTGTLASITWFGASLFRLPCQPFVVLVHISQKINLGKLNLSDSCITCHMETFKILANFFLSTISYFSSVYLSFGNFFFFWVLWFGYIMFLGIHRNRPSKYKWIGTPRS